MIVAADVDDLSILMGDTVAAAAAAAAATTEDEFLGETCALDRPLAGEGPLVCCVDAAVARSGVVCVEFCGDVDSDERAMRRARTARR